MVPPPPPVPRRTVRRRPSLAAPAPEAHAAAVEEWAQKWSALRAGLLASPRDGDLVHDLRVASRRLSELLALVDGLAGRGRIRKALRTLVDELGGPREADVTALLVISWAPEDEAGAPLRALFEARRDRAREAGATPWAGSDGERLEGLVQRASRTIGTLSRNRPGQLAEELAGRTRRRLVARLAPLAGEIPQDPDPFALHRLRIAAKKLRYLCEVLPGAAAKRLEGVSRSFQRAAGDWHDAAMAERHLSEVEAEAFERGEAPLAAAAAAARRRALADRATFRAKSLRRLGPLRSLSRSAAAALAPPPPGVETPGR